MKGLDLRALDSFCDDFFDSFFTEDLFDLDLLPGLKLLDSEPGLGPLISDLDYCSKYRRLACSLLLDLDLDF